MSTRPQLGRTDHWIGHRRADDDELVGFLVPAGSGFVPVTVFGYAVGEAADFEDAVRVLESVGLSYLAERWRLRHEDGWLAVEIVEASPERVVVASVEFGDTVDYGQRFTLEAPVGADVLAMR